jgi:hypothetical protein
MLGFFPQNYDRFAVHLFRSFRYSNLSFRKSRYVMHKCYFGTCRMSANGQVHTARSFQSNANRRRDDEESEGPYELGQYGYGKNSVKLLHVHRDGSFHSIREYEVSTHLKLLSTKDFMTGDNKDIIATDTQKNIVYILAKKYGVSPSRHLQVFDNSVPYITRVGLQHHRQVEN